MGALRRTLVIFMKYPNTCLPPHTFKKTSEQDICNICLKSAKLTLDHVPPEATLPVPRARVRPLFARADRPRYSQSGVKFRTLCGTCNGDRLGGDYDKALLEMCKQARRLHRNVHLIRQLPYVEIDPGKVIRSIFGHLLAAKDHTPRSRADDLMRRFFMDPASTDLVGLNVLYWAHPDRSIRMCRDTVVVDFDGSQIEMVRCDMLIWYPLGFLVCDSIPVRMSYRPPLNMPHMDEYLSQPGVTQVPLRALASGVFERWWNRTGKVTGAPGETAYQAEHPLSVEVEG